MVSILDNCSAYHKEDHEHIAGYKCYNFGGPIERGWPPSKKAGWLEAAGQDPNCFKKWKGLFSKVLNKSLNKKRKKRLK